MSESHTCTIHHVCTDFVVTITRTDDDADWEIDTIRAPSMMPGDADSVNLVDFLDESCPGVADELLDLAIRDLAATDEMHRIDAEEDREMLEATA